MNDTILEVQQINKYFYEPQKFRVLNDITLNIKRGHFVSIVGKSGSGKSTLLYVLSTMDTDYEGKLTLNGCEMHGQKQNYLASFRNENIGFVFQFHYLLPEFTVLQNVMIPALKLNKLPKAEIEHNAYERLKMLGVAEQATKKASKLSGGQQQRVAIARSLINNPAIIMGDEPTGNLDSENSTKVFNIFRELAEQYNQTIIVVTHDSEFARKSDYIIEMKDGQIVNK